MYHFKSVTTLWSQWLDGRYRSRAKLVKDEGTSWCGQRSAPITHNVDIFTKAIFKRALWYIRCFSRATLDFITWIHQHITFFATYLQWLSYKTKKIKIQKHGAEKEMGQKESFINFFVNFHLKFWFWTPGNINFLNYWRRVTGWRGGCCCCSSFRLTDLLALSAIRQWLSALLPVTQPDPIHLLWSWQQLFGVSLSHTPETCCCVCIVIFLNYKVCYKVWYVI